jgi:hypothetical protein
MNSSTDITIRRVLVGHRAAVNVVDFDDKYIVSASGDRTIKVWVRRKLYEKMHLNLKMFFFSSSYRIQQLVNLFEHYLDINVVLRVYNIVIKLLLVAHQTILFVYGILNVVHVYVFLKDMMNLYVAFVLIPNELFLELMMGKSKFGI